MNTAPKQTKRRRLGRLATTALVTVIVGFASACAQTRPAPAAADTPLELTQATHAELQRYLGLVSSTRGGAFAVSPDGMNSYYVFCPEITCSPNLYGGIAKTQCYSITGAECLLLFVRDEPRRAFTVAEKGGLAGYHGHKRAMPLNELPIFNRD